MAVSLDDNERAYLKALMELDPEGEYALNSWAPDLIAKARELGADEVATTHTGSQSVCRRLRQRKLVDAQGRGDAAGYWVNDKGKEAIAE